MALVPGVNIGAGLFVLLVLWFATVLTIIALAAVPKARLLIAVVVLVSLVITLILVFYPRESADQTTTPTLTQDVDEVFYGRLVLLLVMFLFLMGGGVLVFTLHCVEPIQAGHKQQPYYITS